MFGCGYLNGGCQVATAQFLLFAGTMFSVAAFGDCSLVTVDPGISVTQSNVDDLVVDRIGLLTFARPGMSTCYWYGDGNNPENQLQDYFDSLGDDWYNLRIFAAVGASGGVFFFLYTLSMCCSSHTMALRAVVAFILCAGLTLFQCLIFLVFTTDICSEHECTFSRSSGWSVGAALCYFLSGVCYLLMRDYPGRQVVNEIPGSSPSSKTPVEPVDETMIQDHNDEGHVDEEEISVNDNIVAEPVVVNEDKEKIEEGGIINDVTERSQDVEEEAVSTSDTTADNAITDATNNPITGDNPVEVNMSNSDTTTDNDTTAARNDQMTTENPSDDAESKA